MPESQAVRMTRLDDLLTFLAARGGIASFTVVVEQGFARRTVESGVAVVSSRGHAADGSRRRMPTGSWWPPHGSGWC